MLVGPIHDTPYIGGSPPGVLIVTAAGVQQVLPTSGGADGDVLTIQGDGSTAWETPSGGGGTPGGSDAQLQFNDAGAFGGVPGVTWDGSSLLVAPQGIADVPLVVKAAAGQTGNLTEWQNSSGTVLSWIANDQTFHSYRQLSVSNVLAGDAYGIYVSTSGNLSGRRVAVMGYSSAKIGHKSYGVVGQVNRSTTGGPAVTGSIYANNTYSYYATTCFLAQLAGASYGSMPAIICANVTSLIWKLYEDRFQVYHASGFKFGSADTEKLGWWGTTPVVQPASADQADITLGNTDGEIEGLTFSATPTQAEVEALRDKCEELADDVGTLTTLVRSLRTALVDTGLIKGAA